MKKLFWTWILLILCLPVALWADQRTEPIDVIIALDKSLSMEEEISAVIDYVNGYVIDQLLIPGDFFIVVAFYGKTEIPVAMKIADDQDKAQAKRAIAKLIADGRFTDIGNALDTLGAELEKLSGPNRKKYLLLISDGIQEAPPTSKYYSPDGRFNHEFLQNTKVIQKKGWKIHILGIGTHKEAQELAEDLSAKFTGVSETPTKEEFIEKTKDFLASIELVDGVRLSAMDYWGSGSIKLTVQSKGYTEEKQVTISEIRLSLPERPEQNILQKPFSLSIPLAAPLSGSIPIRLSSRLGAGEYTGSVQFFFTSEEHFTPVVVPVAFHVQSLLEGYWWGLLIIAAILALLATAIVVLVSRTRKAKIRFRLVIDDKKKAKGEKIFTIVEGTPLFLEEVEGAVIISARKSPQSLARLTSVSKGVRMTLLQAARFPRLKDLPQNILDFDFKVRTAAKKEIGVRLAGLK